MPATTFDPNTNEDRDGLTYHQDVTNHFTDPTVFDTDMDGLPDGFEVNVAATNPTLDDSFGHGSSDAETCARKVAHQGPGIDPVQDELMAPPSLPADDVACRIEGTYGGVTHKNEDGSLHQHCFLEDQVDPESHRLLCQRLTANRSPPNAAMV